MDVFQSDDPYEILGVPRHAARGEIKRAFRRLAKTHHPDRNKGDAGAARRYSRISAAHDLLIDPENYALQLDFFEALHGARKLVQASDGAQFDLVAPPGTREGDVIRLHGQGEASGLGGRYGDAFVEISIRPHAVFALQGDDVCRDLKVGLREAVFGARVEVETPDGPAVVAVPAKSNSGDVLRIRGRGFPRARGKDRGDLLMKILVMLPEHDDPGLEHYLREEARSSP